MKETLANLASGSRLKQGVAAFCWIICGLIAGPSPANAQFKQVGKAPVTPIVARKQIRAGIENVNSYNRQETVKKLVDLTPWFRSIIDEELIAAWKGPERDKFAYLQELYNVPVAAAVVEYSWRQDRPGTFNAAYTPTLKNLMSRYFESAKPFLDDLLHSTGPGGQPLDLTPAETTAVCRILLDMPDIRTWKQSALQILPHYREQTQALLDSDLHSSDPDQRNRALHWRADLAPADRTAAAPTSRSPPPGGDFTGELEPGVYRAENGVSRPTLRAQTEPKYSKLATKLRVEGVVVVQAVITPEGTARSLQVVKPMGFGLDESALAAVLQWQFNPGMKDGNPVSVAATVEVKFRLNHPPGDSNTWYAGPIAFAPLAGVTAPVVVDGTMPKGIHETAHETADESVLLEFTVDARGAVSKMSALHGTEPSAELLASYLSKWKFRPAMKSGQAVEAVGRVRFYKGQGDQPNPQNP